MRWLPALVAVLLLACEVPAGPQEGTFTILTYNVHGLPSSITGDDTAGRTEQIAPLLDQFDVVGLQEDFIDTNHAVLEAASSHPTRLWFGDTVEDRVYGSGLSLFAPFEVIEDSPIHYTECNGVLDGASDCLASKGLQVATLELGDGVEVDFLNTHLEAGGGDLDDEARVSQIAQVVERLQGGSGARPVVFTGDFNLHLGEDPDDEQLDQLIGGGDLSDACEAVGCDDATHIDRVFFRGSANLTWTVDAWADRSADFLDDEGVDLSDHPPIEATLSWRFEP
jgi:endonuclease/exonuclease/phosphatase family metal-dependent hydrolase